MAQHALMKKNLQMLSKDADHQKEEIKRLRDKEQRLLDSIFSLEKDIQSHKKEIREREETITGTITLYTIIIIVNNNKY
jgi:hypothetical protein